MTTNEEARADLAAVRAQLIGYQDQPAFEGVLGLAACVATVDVAIQSMDSQLQARATQQATEVEVNKTRSREKITNPIAGTDLQDEQAEETLTPADPSVVRAMRLGCHPVATVVMLANCVLAAYICVRVLPLLHPSLEVAAWAGAGFWVMHGAIGVFSLGQTRAHLQEVEREAGRGAPGGLVALFAEPVRSAAAAEVSKQLKEAKAGIVVGCLAGIGIVCALLYFAFVDLPPDAVAAIVACILTVPVGSEGTAKFATSLPAAAAGTILADKAGRLADRIRSSPCPVPADAFLRDINSLHAAVEAVSAMLAPGIGGGVFFAVALAAVCLVVAIGPGPPLEHWLNANAHYRGVFLGLAVFLPMFAIYGALGGPAKITTACDEIASELNALRNAKNKLAPLVVRDQVEALERYVTGVGLGFNLFHIRISYTFVYSCLVQLITVGTIVTPVLLTQISQIVEDGARGDEGSLAQ